MSVHQSQWNILRQLLLGVPVASENCTRELAQAAVQGGVLRLATERAPGLDKWVSRELEQVIFQDMLLERANQDLAATLGDLDDSILRLKGSASAYMLYDNTGLRERRDIDLLLTGESRTLAVDRMLRAGWQRLPEEERPWWAGRRGGRYEETLVKDFGGQRVEADLHFRLSLYRHLGGLVDNLHRRSTRQEGVSFRLPSQEDLMLHTALHAASTGFRVPIKSWLDLHRLCSTNALDWTVLVERAISWKIPTVLWAGLWVIRRWFDTNVPIGALEQLTPPRPAKRSLTFLLGGDGETPIRSGPFHEARCQVAKSFALGGSKPWELALEQTRIRLERSE